MSGRNWSIDTVLEDGKFRAPKIGLKSLLKNIGSRYSAHWTTYGRLTGRLPVNLCYAAPSHSTSCDSDDTFKAKWYVCRQQLLFTKIRLPPLICVALLYPRHATEIHKLKRPTVSLKFMKINVHTAEFVAFVYANSFLELVISLINDGERHGRDNDQESHDQEALIAEHPKLEVS